MAKNAQIDLIIHRHGASAMIHSARTDFNVAVAPGTAKTAIAPLQKARERIEGSLTSDSKITPDELDGFGRALAAVLFSGSVRQLYDSAANGTSVQISLCATDAVLKSIPWEFVRWPDVQSAPHPSRCLCRLVSATQTKPLPNVRLTDGIRVMLVVSQPNDQPTVEWVETEAEMRRIFAANTPPSGAKGIKLELRQAVGAENLRKEVQAFDPHIVHFIGHGAPQGLWLVKHQTNSSARLLPANQVHNVLSSKSTRLVILSACDTANTGTDIAPLVSIAEQMVQAGLPAVVANQMPISLRSVVSFCGALYTELLKSGNVDWAVNAGRIALGVEYSNLNVAAVEWGVPVLYRRPGCSQMFVPGAQE